MGKLGEKSFDFMREGPKLVNQLLGTLVCRLFGEFAKRWLSMSVAMGQLFA
jgi:hypothetical protein